MFTELHISNVNICIYIGQRLKVKFNIIYFVFCCAAKCVANQSDRNVVPVCSYDVICVVREREKKYSAIVMSETGGS